jgi:hypothetical protein
VIFMADKEEEKKDEVPSFRISPKKVDDSWKEEARREREAAARAESGKASPAGRAAPEPPAQRASAPAHDHGHEHGAHDHGHEHGHAHDGEDEGEEAKPKGTPAEQQQTRMFMSFLAGLAQQALMQMGEIENPFSGQREVDLQGARGTIELLTIIQNKTKGNLTEDEDAALKDAVRDLKMRYVEITQEMQRQMAQQAAKAAGAMKPGPGGTIGRRKG